MTDQLMNMSTDAIGKVLAQQQKANASLSRREAPEGNINTKKSAVGGCIAHVHKSQVPQNQQVPPTKGQT